MALGFKQIVESNGVKDAGIQLMEIAREEKARLDNWGIRELYEAFCGESRVKSFLDTRPGFHPEIFVQEDAVQSSAFSNIIGVLITNEVIAAYDSTPKIGDKLCEIYKSKQLGERMAGFTAADDPEDVNENQDYPEAGFNDKYVTLPDPKKKGKVIYLTEEAIFYDQTGQVIERAKEIGERMAEQREMRIISGVVGGHVCYHPLGVPTALYGGSPQLVGSNGLADYTDIEKCELDGFDAMEDDKGNKISVIPRVLLVPRALYRTALSIVNATQVAKTTGSSVYQTWSANPIQNGEFEVLTSPHVSTYVGNSTSWFMGDPKKQFRLKEVYPIQTFRLADTSMLKFKRDVEFAFKVRGKWDIFAKDNKYFCKNDA